MKKFLSLVLALVMTMSLVTVSAGAKDFTDNSKIQYKEAVDVLSAVKVIDGYTDGAFNPANTLTRGAAAKIICNLLLGPTTANALSADAAPYKDVPVSNNFSGYIAYCAKEGIISGYADGTFRPGNSLTGYAFMKMLLGALGYDAKIEGYTGNNWSIAVAKRALNVGLDNGLKEDFNGVKAVTREEACLYAFNMLKADMVEYDKKSTIKVGDITITDNSTAQSKRWGSSAAADGNIDGKANGDGYVQFAEEYFNKLKKTSGNVTDAFGRPSTQWTYKGEEVGTYAKTPDVTYSKSVKLADIYADLKMTSKDTTADLYENGLNTVSDFTVSKSADAKTDKLSEMGKKLAGDGTIVEVFRDDDTNHVDICVISVYVGEVVRTKDATKTKDAYVVVDNKTSVNLDTGKSYKNEFETTGFAEDDIVAFTYSAKDNEIKTMYKLTATTGTLTKRSVGKSLTLGETTYTYNKNVGYGDGLTNDSSMTNKGEYNVYLDANGYVLYVEENEAALSSYALVTAVGSAFDSGKAKLVFTDGTKKTVSTTKDYTGTLIAGDIVTYKVENGEYKLTKKTNANNVWDNGREAIYDNNFVMDKKDSEITISSAKVNGKTTTKIYADSATVFVIQKDNGDFKTYTGIKNVPSVDAGTNDTQVSFLCKDGVKATIVFVSTKAANVSNTSDDILFVAGNSVSDKQIDIDDNEYYEYNAVVNGKITTVKVDSTKSVSGLENGIKEDANHINGFMFDAFSNDNGDLLTSATATFGGSVSDFYGIGVKKMTGAYSVRVDTAGSDLLMTVADNAKIFYVDKDGKIEESSLKEVKTDANDQVLYTVEKGEITNLFVIEVKG